MNMSLLPLGSEIQDFMENFAKIAVDLAAAGRAISHRIWLCRPSPQSAARRKSEGRDGERKEGEREREREKGRKERKRGERETERERKESEKREKERKEREGLKLKPKAAFFSCLCHVGGSGRNIHRTGLGNDILAQLWTPCYHPGAHLHTMTI